MSKAPPFSPHRQFADNLRALCTQHGSIAAVCRALGMNRQQFNKYLAGSTLPNGPTLQRICAFFAVQPAALFVYRRDGATLFTRFTKFRALGQQQRYYLSGRHDGVALDGDTGKFLLALNHRGHGDISMVTLGAETSLTGDFMSGLALVMEPDGRPLALRATLEYRGASSLLRRTIAEAGLLPLSAPGIPEQVRHSLCPATAAGRPMLSPYSLLDGLTGAA